MLRSLYHSFLYTSFYFCISTGWTLTGRETAAHPRSEVYYSGPCCYKGPQLIMEPTNSKSSWVYRQIRKLPQPMISQGLRIPERLGQSGARHLKNLPMHTPFSSNMAPFQPHKSNKPAVRSLRIILFFRSNNFQNHPELEVLMFFLTLRKQH